jgi:hypothetical protein
MPKPGPGGKKRGKAATFLANYNQAITEENIRTIPHVCNLVTAIPKAVRKTRRDFAKNDGPK